MPEKPNPPTSSPASSPPSSEPGAQPPASPNPQPPKSGKDIAAMVLLIDPFRLPNQNNRPQ